MGVNTAFIAVVCPKKEKAVEISTAFIYDGNELLSHTLSRAVKKTGRVPLTHPRRRTEISTR